MANHSDCSPYFSRKMDSNRRFRSLVLHFLMYVPVAIGLGDSQGMASVETGHTGTLEETVCSRSSQPPPRVMAVATDQAHGGAGVRIPTVHFYGPTRRRTRL